MSQKEAEDIVDKVSQLSGDLQHNVAMARLYLQQVSADSFSCTAKKIRDKSSVPFMHYEPCD